MKYIIDSNILNDLDISVLDFIRNAFPDYEDHFWQNSGTWEYECSKAFFDEIKKIEEKEHIKGFESNSDYEDFFFENQEDIINELEENSDNIYEMLGADKQHISPQQFYRGLYYDNDTGKTCYKVFSLISKYIVKTTLDRVIYNIENNK